MQEYLGEFSALFTAFCWTVTAIAFERAGLKIGSLQVNIIRIFMGFFFLSIFVWFRRGMIFPMDASVHNWIWLLLSGMIGFALGDLFLFKSYTIIGSRFSMLIMTLVPPIAAFTGWLLMGETLTPVNLLGMGMTITGIALAIFNRGNGKKRLTLKLSMKGILFALGGAAGQAVGLVLSKYGMEDYDPFAATQIRLIAGMAGFVIIVTGMRRWKKVFRGFSSKQGMTGTAVGAFFGPFLGVSFSLLAVKYTETGIASTIMAIVPVLIIPPAIILYREKITSLEIVGAFISIAGVSLLFLF